MCVCCECCVLSGRGLYNGLITHPEYYQLWCCVWSRNLVNEEVLDQWGMMHQIKKNKLFLQECLLPGYNGVVSVTERRASVFCETNVYYTDTLKGTVSYRPAKHHEHFYTTREQQWLNLCPICHTANIDAAVHLSPHVWTSVEGDGLQHRRSLCGKRGTHRASVNCHTHSFTVTSLYFLTVLPKRILLEVLISSVKTLYLLNHFFFFPQPNAHNMLNTYIYRQLPPTCFGVCYTIFRETTALLYAKAYSFWESNAMVSLKMVWQTPKHVGGSWR
jgi:hypothetical protein